MLTVGSLFAGIGGFDLGLERAGLQIRWQVEIDPFCQAVLRKHWPNVRRYDDVRTVTGTCLDPVDVICGGFPCQDVSRAGLRAGIEGERSGLWFHMDRLIRHLRPRYIVVENTAGLLDDGIGRVLSDLAGAGYDAEWACIQAHDLGAPHERERVFIAAYPNCGDGQARLGHIDESERPPLFAGDYPQRSDFWLASTCKAVGVDDGIRGEPYRRRVESVGNAIVPQIAEWIGRRICEYEETVRV